MTADEMFKVLGYEKVEENKSFIIYEVGTSQIRFVLKLKKFRVCDDLDIFKYTSMEELQAINKKCEEMGWLK